MKYWLSIFLLLPATLVAQDTLQLWQCYQWSWATDPLTQISGQMAQQSALQQDNIHAQRLPDLQLKAKATYQSDVPGLNIDLPMIDLPLPQQDQYAVTLEAKQSIYTGGRISAQKELEVAQLATQQQSIEAQQYQRHHLVNKHYFYALQSQWKAQLLQLQSQELVAQLDRLQAAVEEGAALPGTSLALEAQLLQLEQQINEARAQQQQAMQALSILTGQSLDTSLTLQLPQIAGPDAIALQEHPQWQTFDLQQQQLLQQEQLVQTQRQPTVGAFATAGYGRPGLNPFETTFQPYYIAGLQLQWKLWDWSTAKRQRASLRLQKDIIEQQRTAFTQQQTLQFEQLSIQQSAYGSWIEQDRQLIDKREQLQVIAASQMEEGIITAQEYLSHVTAKQLAEWQLKGHQLQLAFLTVQQYTLLGQLDALNSTP